MLERIFEFSDLRVHNIMRHRSLVRHIYASDSFENVIKIFEETGYSRILVYENDSEEIVGMLYFKDVLFADKKFALAMILCASVCDLFFLCRKL